jgi:hypothetical protein
MHAAIGEAVKVQVSSVSGCRRSDSSVACRKDDAAVRYIPRAGRHAEKTTFLRASRRDLLSVAAVVKPLPNGAST